MKTNSTGIIATLTVLNLILSLYVILNNRETRLRNAETIRRNEAMISLLMQSQIAEQHSNRAGIIMSQQPPVYRSGTFDPTDEIAPQPRDEKK